MSFSALERSQIWENLGNEYFDVLIIGGGITGAGIALDAVSRGLKVALIEKNDFASGTSSRSTKLVHGGLRYLKQFEFALVRDVGLERAIVCRNAPHVVSPERMLLPIVEGGSLGKTLSSIGLWVYDFLAKVPKEERRKMLSKEKTSTSEPLLRTDILKGGGVYYEYRTDDARLTIETLKRAAELGAVCLNYAEAKGFEYEQGKINAARVQDMLSDTGIYPKKAPFIHIKAKKIINAAGPWVDTLRSKDTDGIKGKRLHLTKGVHIVVPKEKLPIQQSVYFDVLKDKRMVFAIPRGKITYIGTTDTNYTNGIDNPVANYADINYIIEAVNELFPTVRLTPDDVISTWAGLRPLIHEEGKSPSELSRKDEIFIAPSGLISMAGGKLTGYRKMSEKVVNLVCKDLGIKKPCITKGLRLSGGNFNSAKEIQHFTELRIGEATQIGLSAAVITDWVSKYGTNTDLILEYAYKMARQYTKPAELAHAAELKYAIEQEMVYTLSDYLVRRTGRLYFERPSLAEWQLPIGEMMSQFFNWTEEQKLRNLALFQKEYKEVMNWKTEIK